MDLLRNANILLTGGTGSFGRAFIRYAIDHVGFERLVVFSRDELKQSELREHFSDERLRFFIGDVRDLPRLTRAMDGIDLVVHAAALKQVDTAEYNPFECIKTNVIGAQNVIDAAIDKGVKRVVALSTDKASSPINLYGASKLCADKLFVAGNHYAAHSETRFAVVRYGNVLGSRGSVVPLFQRLVDGGELPITDRRMTRFWITLERAVELVLRAFTRMSGGELYVPKIPSMRIVDLAVAIAPRARLVETGIRPGEKLHEEMISQDDARRTYEFDDHYVVLPVLEKWGPGVHEQGKPVPEDFSYRSDTNTEWLSPEDLRQLLSLSR